MNTVIEKCKYSHTLQITMKGKVVILMSMCSMKCWNLTQW